MAENIRFQYYFSEGSGDTLNDFSYYNDDATIVEDGNWSVDTPFDAGSKSAQLSPYSYDFSGNYFKHIMRAGAVHLHLLYGQNQMGYELFSSVFSTGMVIIQLIHGNYVSSNNKWRINDTANQYIINNISEYMATFSNCLEL